MSQTSGGLQSPSYMFSRDRSQSPGMSWYQSRSRSPPRFKDPPADRQEEHSSATW